MRYAWHIVRTQRVAPDLTHPTLYPEGLILTHFYSFIPKCFEAPTLSQTLGIGSAMHRTEESLCPLVSYNLVEGDRQETR